MEMAESQDREPSPVENPASLPEVLDRIPKLIDKAAVVKMINLQNKLATTTKLYKRTSKQLSDSKKDLDIIYKKILDLKAKIRAERPELFSDNKDNCEAQKEDEPKESTSSPTTPTTTSDQAPKKDDETINEDSK